MLSVAIHQLGFGCTKHRCSTSIFIRALSQSHKRNFDFETKVKEETLLCTALRAAWSLTSDAHKFVDCRLGPWSPTFASTIFFWPHVFSFPFFLSPATTRRRKPEDPISVTSGAEETWGHGKRQSPLKLVPLVSNIDDSLAVGLCLPDIVRVKTIDASVTESPTPFCCREDAQFSWQCPKEEFSWQTLVARSWTCCVVNFKGSGVGDTCILLFYKS